MGHLSVTLFEMRDDEDGKDGKDREDVSGFGGGRRSASPVRETNHQEKIVKCSRADEAESNWFSALFGGCGGGRGYD